MNRTAQPRPRKSWYRMLAALTAVTAVLVLAACGGSSAKHSGGGNATASNTRSAATQTRPSTSPCRGLTRTGTTPAKANAIHASIRGQNHTPTVGKPWSYLVTVTDAAGKPLSGSVSIEFLFGGQVVGHDTPPTHPLTRGHLRATLTFPARSIGIPLDVGALIRTHQGSAKLTWPVKVERSSH
jgi:hypothetical protein